MVLCKDRIYNDYVFKCEVDDTRARNYYGNSAPIQMSYALNPFYTGRHYQQQPNFVSWLYPLYQPAISSSVPDGATTSSESKQQNIPCGVGPASPPQRKTPTVGIVGGSEAVPNSWPFVVSLRNRIIFTAYFYWNCT